MYDMHRGSPFTLLIWATLIWLATASAAMADGDQAVSLNTSSGNLSGSLVLPAGKEKSPIALIIPGSGPVDRNGNVGAANAITNSLKYLAESLAQAGFASVRYDKRGIAASGAASSSEADLRFETYVNDAAAWIEQLKRDPRFSSVAVIGHSEGSLIGMLAARQANADAFVSIAGLAQGAAETVRAQLRNRLTGALAERSQEILKGLEQGRTTKDVPRELAALYRESVQPYLISWFRYIPSAELVKLTIPVLLLHGSTDIQINVAEAEALKRAKPDAELVIVPGMNHVLKPVPADMSKQMASYNDPALPLAPELNAPLMAFLKKSLR
jgi:uncharacterized protein